MIIEIKVFKSNTNEFKKCGYDVFHKLLNAYDFGLPKIEIDYLL